MQALTTAEFTEVLEFSQPNCVSMYFPTDSTNADPRINKTAFKNITNRTIDQLKQLGVSATAYSGLDQLCEALMDDDEFWKQQDQGFAVFAAGEWVKTFKLSQATDELVMINDHFYVTPLIPLLQAQNTFFILELDKEHTKMWRGDVKGLQPVSVPDLPKSIVEVVGLESNERNLQFHTGTDAPGGGKRPAMYHGSSSWEDDKDRYLEQFLKAVDKAVVEFFKHTKYPLFISGVEELVVAYRKYSKYQALETNTLAKVDDPNHRPEKLHKEALQLVTAKLQEYQATAVANFEEEPHQERKVTVLAEVLRQAAQGKIATLLIAEGAKVWGTFAPETLSVVTEIQQHPQSGELVNYAARLTLIDNGEVTVLPAEQVPGGNQVAAVLRY